MGTGGPSWRLSMSKPCKNPGAYELAHLSEGDRLLLSADAELEQPEEVVKFLEYSSDEGRVDVLAVEDAAGGVLEITPEQVKEIL
jgi:hypothetical protein